MRGLNCELHEAPSLLRREVSSLFPDRDVINKHLSVITLSQKTANDMSGWSNEVEKEREDLIEHFLSAAKELCGRLKSDGYWSDFIDPTSGKPYFGQYTNTTMFETDEKYRLLGFRIEDLGCCKVISHKEFGRNVFVGTIFTDAHPSNGVVQVCRNAKFETWGFFKFKSYHGNRRNNAYHNLLMIFRIYFRI